MSLYSAKVFNFISKSLKLLTVVSIKIFTVMSFIVSGLIWYNNVYYAKYMEGLIINIIFIFIILLSIIIIYLMVTSINNKSRVKFTDKLKMLYKNKWLFIITGFLFIIPRNILFQLANLSINEISYIPCIMFTVLVTSVPITFIITLLMSLYKCKSFINSISHAVYAVKQMDYMLFFTIIIITFFVCMLKIFTLLFILPLFIVSNIYPISYSCNNTNVFTTQSPVENTEISSKSRSPSPSSVSREFLSKLDSRRRDLSPIPYPNTHYNIQGKTTTISTSCLLIGRTDIECSDPALANRLPFIYFSRNGGGVIKDAKNNILGWQYKDRLWTSDGKLIDKKVWQPKAIFATMSPWPSDVVRLTYHNDDYVEGKLCKEGHFHNDKGVPLGVVTYRWMYHPFDKDTSLSIASSSPIIRPVDYAYFYPDTLPTEKLKYDKIGIIPY